jgi:quercetin dioxygenase-like cupin family protein
MADTQSFVLSPVQGEKYAAGPFDITARVVGSQSDGAFELYELGLGSKGTVDYHVHRTMDETIFVLEGQIEFLVAGEKFSRPPGSVAFVKRGIHHGFSNVGSGRARVLLHFNPARNQDEYFRQLVKLFAAPSLDVTALQAAQKRFDQELVPPGK